jgi:hypothetical protein
LVGQAEELASSRRARLRLRPEGRRAVGQQTEWAGHMAMPLEALAQGAPSENGEEPLARIIRLERTLSVVRRMLIRVVRVMAAHG